MKDVGRQLFCALVALLLLVGCSSGTEQPGAQQPGGWVDEDVTFDADGLTIHGTYRHVKDAPKGPAALLISESGNTDRNGDNAVAGPVGNMRQLAEYLSGKGIASLRYDKVGTGKTGLGPYEQKKADVGSAVYTAGAKSAVRYLAAQPGTEASAISVYALGEGTVHAVSTGRRHRAGRTEDPGAWPVPAAVRSVPRHHHRTRAHRHRRRREVGRQDPPTGRRRAQRLERRGRRGPHQGHRAHDAA